MAAGDFPPPRAARLIAAADEYPKLPTQIVAVVRAAPRAMFLPLAIHPSPKRRTLQEFYGSG